jgi:hypothetical protein
MEVNDPVIKMVGNYCTDLHGIDRLIQIYDYASSFQDTSISLDCSELRHLDANLVSLLAALDYKLHLEKNVHFKTDFHLLKKKFSFLFHNGFLKDESFTETDPLQRPLQLTQIDLKDERKFIDFLTGKLMCHNAILPIEERLQKRIRSEIIELYTNICRHSQTQFPFFACGHYYDRAGIFKITIVDLGVGFLPPIFKYTNGEIKTDGDAIQWALEGYNTTSGEPLAGMGLKGMLDFCSTTSGTLQIISGNDFWGTDIKRDDGKSYERMKSRFNGTILNLWVKSVNIP